jgi:poly-gamma-glutamate capsule biosynthesis protein CapA/YwtB (metallophosphatase superfamily)
MTLVNTGNAGCPARASSTLARVTSGVLHRACSAVRANGRLLPLAAALIGAAGLAAACGAGGGREGGGETAAVSEATAPTRGETAVRLLFAGDVMLGRGVAKVAAADPASLFAGIRLEVSSASLAVANLESPLTSRRHDPLFGPNALEAPPASARLLAGAGFDAMTLANNHAGDAGPKTVTDTVRALSTTGIRAVGAGRSAAQAFQPQVVEAGGLRVALLAFDATGQGPRAGPETPGAAWWDEALARRAVARARSSADVVAVAIHGGAEYVPATDPYLMRLGRLLASWGADVVWGHGPHVVQPVSVIDPDGDGRPTVVATSLGNLLFDQHIPATRSGAILEVLAGADGVRAFRIGSADHTDGPVRFLGWLPPVGGAAALDDGWWTLASPAAPVRLERPRALERFEGDVVDAAIGDPDGDGRRDLVVAFRRPFSPTEVNALVPPERLVDRQGRTAHLGLYRPRDLRPRWVAGTLLRPVAAVAPCDGAIAVAYSALDDPAVVGAGAWRWGGFGFVPLPDLPGPGLPACSDVDGDGRLDPLVLERSVR